MFSILSSLEIQAFAQGANPVWRRSTRNLLVVEKPLAKPVKVMIPQTPNLKLLFAVCRSREKPVAKCL